MVKKYTKNHILKDNILVIGAHSDDPIYGMGGTLIKAVEKGANVYTVIFSYGELHPFHLKREEAVKIRVKEAQDANKFIGGKDLIFYGLKEGKFEDEFYQKNLQKHLRQFIIKKRIRKIFTHIHYDPLPDHKAVNKIVLNLVDELPKQIKNNINIYGFDVWNMFNIKIEYPKLYIKITKQFKRKIQAIKLFRSQRITWFTLVWNLLLKSFLFGLKIKAFSAERFYKIK